MDKIKLNIIELCSGIGFSRRGIENTDCFEPYSVATSEIDIDAIISYSAIHCGLTEEMVDSYDAYPSMPEMRNYLKDLNIGYSPEKDKEYNWFKTGKAFERKVKKTWLACMLNKNVGDISKVERLPKADMWFLSFPCFVEGTLVYTSNGYKPIEEIKEGDLVLTHTNTFQKVNTVMINEANSLIKIHCMTSEAIHCTPNHPFYVREKYRVWNENRRGYDRYFYEPKWVKAKDLSRDYYLGTAINPIEEVPTWNGYIDGHGIHKNKLEPYMSNKDFWYLIGRYIGDGWQRSGGGIIICANDTEVISLTECLDNLSFNYNIVKERTANKVHIGFKEIGIFCEQFGRGAINKHLTSTVLNLPIDLLRSFLEGYITADGHQDNKGNYKITSISRELLYDVASCIHKVYHRPTSMYFTARPKTTVIEGRTVNQHDTYTISWKMDANTQDKAFYEDGYIWSPITDVNDEEYQGLVYNISVDKDESYMIQNVIVHNCTDLSNAGKMAGMTEGSGTRSSLVWNTIRLLNKAKETNSLPPYMILENVKNLVGKRFIDDFNNFNSLIEESFDYSVKWKIINGRDCGVAQNRERVFAIYIKKDIDKNMFSFPQSFDTGIRLKDILFDDVSEKYYINTDKAEELIKKLVYDNTIDIEKAVFYVDEFK